MSPVKIIKKIIESFLLQEEELEQILESAKVGKSLQEFKDSLNSPHPASAVSEKGCLDFLDGLIAMRRGPSDKESDNSQVPLNNNVVLKKLRIALDFREFAMLEMFNGQGIELSSSELTALFRKEGHKHYRECDDQMLMSFFNAVKVHFEDKV